MARQLEHVVRLAVVAPGTATLSNSGPHGFSEVLYAFTSATANNGSAFAGLGANMFWQVTMAIAMFMGRFLFIGATVDF